MSVSSGSGVTSTSTVHSVPARPVSAWIETFRPSQWLKNVFVVVPLLFTPDQWTTPHVIQVATAFIIFCLASGAAYIWNDWCDRDIDRLHPKKSQRPLPSGRLSPRTALAVAGVLAVVAVASAWAMSASLGWLMAVYLLIQACYSVWIKHVVILDVMTLASGFVLRVLAGGFAVGIEPSNWLLVTTSLLALFLGFSKRRQEIRHLGVTSSSHRSVLAEYNITFIDQMNAVLTASCILCYALYTIAPETVALYGTERLLLTLPFVVYGLLRYLYLIHVRELGDNPTEVILSDMALQVCIVLWVLTFLWIIRFGS